MVSRNERFPGNVRVRLRVAADRGESAGGCSGSLASLLLVFFLPEDGVAFVVYFLGEVEVTMTFRGLANDVRRARIDLAFELLHAPVLPVKPDPHLVGRHSRYISALDAAFRFVGPASVFKSCALLLSWRGGVACYGGSVLLLGVPEWLYTRTTQVLASAGQPRRAMKWADLEDLPVRGRGQSAWPRAIRRAKS